jgi:hypothetical protein
VQEASWTLSEAAVPVGWVCLVASTLASDPSAPLPPNYRRAPPNAYTPDLVQAVDCVLGNPLYTPDLVQTVDCVLGNLLYTPDLVQTVDCVLGNPLHTTRKLPT